MNYDLKSVMMSVVIVMTVLFAVSCDKKSGSNAFCGDLFVTGSEKCDHGNLDGKTCETLGFGAGTLNCAANCLEFDTSGCGASLTCGNDVKDGSDICDGNDLGGETCQSKGYEEGTLKCMDNCAGFDTTDCGKSLNCGNGKIDSGEVCDGTNLNGRTCVEEGFEEGDLKCSDDCTAFDKSDCYTPCTPDCGDRVCGPDPVCGEPCGDCTGEFEACNDAGQCEKTCELDPLEEGSVINIDLQTADVSGEITLNGSQPANNTQQYYEAESRGSIGFINKKSGSSIYINIGSSGKAAYSATIFKGTYDIVFSPNNASYQNVFPAMNAVLASDVVIDADAKKDFDLETAKISGKITVNGNAMPNNSQQYYEAETRGSIRFTNVENAASVTYSIGSSGEASYSATVYKGTYTVSFDPNNSSYQNAVPAINMILEKDVAVDGDGTKNFNLDTVQLTGKVTLNGKTMPNNSQQYYETESRGSITVSNTVSGGYVSISLGSSGEAAYSTTVFKGTYNFSFSPNNSSYQNSVPAISMILAKDVEINAKTQKDFNLDTVDLSGKVTLNGSAMPNNTRQYYETESRGSITVRNTESGGYLSIGLGSSGEASYSAKVFKGTYAFSLSPNSASYQNVMPDMNLNLDKGLAVNSNTVKNFDLETAEVSGKVTINGKTMANNTMQYYETENRGNIGFKNKGSGATMYVVLGSSGEAAYSATVFKGNYDVSLYPNSASYQNSIPDVDMVLGNNQNLDADKTLNFDLETVNVTGNVKLNGAVMPNNTMQYYEAESRGGLTLRNKSSSDTIYITIGSSGEAKFSTKLFKGSYDVDFSSNSASYQDVLPDQSIKVYKGCFDYSAGCDLDIEDISGTWEFVPDGAYWKPVVFNLVQNGEEITGTFESWNSSGSIQPGTRKGNYIKFQFDPYYEMIVDGTVVSGCTIIGRFDTIGYSGGNYDSDYVGYKVP